MLLSGAKRCFAGVVRGRNAGAGVQGLPRSLVEKHTDGISLEPAGQARREGEPA
jgi:hypothetical protein